MAKADDIRESLAQVNAAYDAMLRRIDTAPESELPRLEERGIRLEERRCELERELARELAMDVVADLQGRVECLEAEVAALKRRLR